MIKRRFFLPLLASFFLITTPLKAEVTAEQRADAERLVLQTAQTVLLQIDERRDDIQADPLVLLEIVDDTLLPHVDSQRMTQLVLGRYARQATAQQREAFTHEFQQLLVRTYAGPLSELGEQSIEVLGSRVAAGNNEIFVETEVHGGDFGTVPVNYRMILDDGRWLVFDVVVDGISLINNYRGSFAQRIQSDGIDGLIETLRTRNER
ncbi:MAG TPA: ABC transporter substrate-binding protein [Halothiobacillaceae bacterium]|nr:ABC transporter substrate-binding protein [Halothiobacillaceae bacterium]